MQVGTGGLGKLPDKNLRSHAQGWLRKKKKNASRRGKDKESNSTGNVNVLGLSKVVSIGVSFSSRGEEKGMHPRRSQRRDQGGDRSLWQRDFRI